MCASAMTRMTDLLLARNSVVGEDVACDTEWSFWINLRHFESCSLRCAQGTEASKLRRSAVLQVREPLSGDAAAGVDGQRFGEVARGQLRLPACISSVARLV